MPGESQVFLLRGRAHSGGLGQPRHTRLMGGPVAVVQGGSVMPGASQALQANNMMTLLTQQLFHYRVKSIEIQRQDWCAIHTFLFQNLTQNATMHLVIAILRFSSLSLHMRKSLSGVS